MVKIFFVSSKIDTNAVSCPFFSPDEMSNSQRNSPSKIRIFSINPSDENELPGREIFPGRAIITDK